MSGRVLIVEQGEGLWGAQRYLLRLAPLLEARGFEQVLAAPRDSAMARAWREAGRSTVDLEVPAGRSVRGSDDRMSARLALREAMRGVGVAWQIARLADRAGADVIHANSHWSHVEGMLAGRLTRRPVILHLHEENEPDLIGRLRGLAVLGADASVAVSAAVARSLPRRAARRTLVIRNGVDATVLSPRPGRPEVRAQLTEDPDAPVVLVLSRLDPRKGVDHAIRAVAGLPTELADTRMAVVGAPSLEPEHGDRLRVLGSQLLGDRIRFLGPRGDVADVMRAADALVLASTLEGLPLSVLEAQACGLPVVAYPTAGIPEIVKHERTGLLATPGDVGDLSRQLARLLRDRDLAMRLAQAGRERVVSESTLDGQATALARVLERLLRRRAAAR